MAHIITPPPPPAPTIAGIPPAKKSQLPFSGLDRRTFTWSLTAGALGLLAGEDNVARAARRPPSPPPQEKTDPNVSGLQAKVLASKKRKEAMKEAMAKLRERGKPINEAPAQPPPTEPSE